MRIKLKHFIVIITAMLTVHCTKERPARVSQGQGVDSVQLSLLDNKLYPLKTKNVKAPLQDTSAIKGIEVSQDYNDQLRIYDIVEYETTAKLLPQGLELRAKENTSDVYQIMYRVSNLYLKVMKVAKEKDIPSFEMDYAEDIGDGLFAVPLLGYPIKHMKVEYAKNNDNEDTNLIIEIPLSEKGGPNSIVKINKNQYERYEALNKNEVFRTSYFQFNKDEWYFSEATVDASGKDEALKQISGHSYDSDFHLATKVKFIAQSNNEVMVVNTAKSVGYEEDNNLIHNAAVLSIGAQFLDYKLTDRGSEKSLSEQQDDLNQREKAKYVKLNLNQLRSLKNITGNIVLDKVYIAKDYFSFTVLLQDVVPGQSLKRDKMGRVNSASKVRYSFKRITKKSTMKPKYAFSDDLKKFGMLYRQKKKLFNDYKNYDLLDNDKFRYVIRFNPEKKIKFYISEGTKKKHYKYADHIVNVWNEYLIKNNINKGVELVNKPISYGDIRGNIIHFDDSVSPTRWLGVNTSLSDPDNGEIFHTKVNISISTTRKFFISYLRKYVQQEVNPKNFIFEQSNLTSSNTLNNSMFMNSKAYNFEIQSDQSNLTPYKSYSSTNGYFFDNHNMSYKPKTPKESEMMGQRDEQGLLPFSLLTSDTNKKFHDHNLNTKLGVQRFQCNNMKHPHFIYKLAEEQCVGEANENGVPSVNEYIKSLKSVKNLNQPLRVDYKVLEVCAEKIMEREIIATGMHELGHALGLDHNFKASSDGNNFYSLEEVSNNKELLSESSSLMDYPGPEVEPMVIPGKYDLAALKFIYKNKVTLSDGSTSKNEITEAPISHHYSKNQLKNFAYCNGFQEYLNLDPMCAKFDNGVTPLEVVSNTIEFYKDHFKSAMYTMNRAKAISQYGYMLYSIETFQKLKSFYVELRKLITRKLGVNHAYLYAYGDDVAFYKKHLKHIEEDEHIGQKYIQYRKASDKIINFLLDMTFMPNHYCLVGDNNSSEPSKPFEIIELDTIRKTLDLGEGHMISSCFNESVVQYIKQFYKSYDTQMDPVVLNEVGHELNSIWYSTQIKDYVYEPISVLGSKVHRLNAFVTLTSRDRWSPVNHINNNFPNFLDEPQYREKIINSIVDRALNGVSLKGSEKHYVKYSYEKSVLRDIYFIFKKGLGVPSHIDIDRDRFRNYETRLDLKDRYDMFARENPAYSRYAYTHLKDDVVIYTTSNSNSVASKLINAHNRLHTLTEEQEINENDFLNLEIHFKTLPYKKDMQESIESVNQLLSNSEFGTQAFFEKFASRFNKNNPDFKEMQLKLEEKKVAFQHFINFFGGLSVLLNGSDRALQNHIKIMFSQELEAYSNFMSKYATKLKVISDLVERRRLIENESRNDQSGKYMAHVKELVDETRKVMEAGESTRALTEMPIAYVLKDEYPELINMFNRERFMIKLNQYRMDHKNRLAGYRNNPIEYKEKQDLLMWMILPFW